MRIHTMKITRKNLKLLIESAISEEAANNIARLWWNDPAGDYTFPGRGQAKSIISALEIDPKSLKIWTLVYPWGGLYEPWTFYGGTGEAPGFSGTDIESIIEHYNSQTREGLELAIDEWDAESGLANFTHPSGAWYDDSEWYNISDMVEKAWFETVGKKTQEQF